MLGDFLSILPDFYQIIWHAFELLWFFCQISQITCYKYLLRITIWSIFSNQEDFFNQILLILFTKGKCFKIMLIYTVTMSSGLINSWLTKFKWRRKFEAECSLENLFAFPWPVHNFNYVCIISPTHVSFLWPMNHLLLLIKVERWKACM